jgi:hypothetical protein
MAKIIHIRHKNTIVREARAFGPCHQLGKPIRQTPKCYIVDTFFGTLIRPIRSLA